MRCWGLVGEWAEWTWDCDDTLGPRVLPVSSKEMQLAGVDRDRIYFGSPQSRSMPTGDTGFLSGGAACT